MSESEYSLFTGTIDSNIILFGEMFLASLTQMAFSGYVLSSSFSIKYMMKDHRVILKVYDELHRYLAIAITFTIIMGAFFYIKSGIDALIIFVLLNIIIISSIYFDYISAITFAVNVRDVVPEDGSKSQFEVDDGYYKKNNDN